MGPVTQPPRNDPAPGGDHEPGSDLWAPAEPAHGGDVQGPASAVSEPDEQRGVGPRSLDERGNPEGCRGEGEDEERRRLDLWFVVING